MSDVAKASDLFGINKFGEFQVDVLNTLLELHRAAALPTKLVMSLVPTVLHYTFYF